MKPVMEHTRGRSINRFGVGCFGVALMVVTLMIVSAIAAASLMLYLLDAVDLSVAYLRVPAVMVAGMLGFFVPLTVIVWLSILYSAVFPDRFAIADDFDGSEHQKMRLAQWRAVYRRLSLPGRIQRAWKVRQRRSPRNGAVPRQ